MPGSGKRAAVLAVFLAAAALCAGVAAADAQQGGARSSADPERVVITGSRSASDQELTRRVEAALDANPYLDASRITVTTTDGVVHLEGIVGDQWDLIRAIRTSNRIAGIKRVVEDLYVPDFYNGE